MKKKLQEELQRVMGQLTTLRAVSDPTEEQNAEIDTLAAQALELTGKISEAEARDARLDELESKVKRSANPLPAGGPAPLPGGGPAAPSGRAIVVPATAKRKTPQQFESLEQAYAFGQFCRSVFGRSEQAGTWLREHGYSVSRAQSEGNNTAGGYLVPSEFGEIIEALIPSYGITRSRCRVVPMSRDTKDHPKGPADMMMRPARELTTVTNDTLSFGNIELVARKWMLILQTSNELTEDAAISIADEVSKSVAQAAAKTEDRCLFRGDGTSPYNSIVGIFNRINNIASNLSAVTLTGVSTYEAVTVAQLLGIVGGINEAATSYDDLAWYATHKAKLELFYRLALAQGGSTANEILTSPNPTFLGYPIIQTNAIANNETSGGFAFGFGSLMSSVIFGNRSEISLVNSVEAGFTTDSEFWRATERFDLNVHEPGSASEAGPFMVGVFA